MEKIRGKKKDKIRAQENVPLNDIIKPGEGDELQSASPQVKKKKARKNEVNPEVASSSFATAGSQSSIRQDAWTVSENVQSNEKAAAENRPVPKGSDEMKGISNPALVLNDEAQLPGSVTDLKDSSMEVAPLPPTISNTVIDNDDEVPIKETEGKSAEETPKSPFHRALFGRMKGKSKSEGLEDKENSGRPATAPGHRVPFPDQVTGSLPQLKRPASALADGGRSKKLRSAQMDMTKSMPALRENSFNVSARSLKDPPEPTHKAVAYVPYVHARNTLSRVIEDMRSMKMSHLSIVMQIEEQYKGIEIESREQFNAYVVSLQDEQRNKINMFKQTIGDHNAEIKERNKYWNDTLQSLSKRNKQLLQHKRALFLARQEDAQKFEKERNELQARLAEHESKLKQMESGKLLLAEPEPLDAQPQIVEAVPVGAAIAVASRDGEKDFDVKSSEEVEKWKGRYEKEREERLEQERRQEREMRQVKAILASRGASTTQERDVYEGKIRELAKELAKVKLEYETTSAFLQSLMASVSGDEQFLAAKKKIEEDRSIMREEQSRLQGEISVWQEEWRKSNGGKLPGEDEKPDAAKELDTQLAEVELMLSNLDEQDAALDMLKEGRTPQSKGEVPDPVVTTVEIRDPSLVRELESAKFEVMNLEEKLKSSAGDAVRISDLENENGDLRARLTEHEKRLADPSVVSTVALGAVAAGRSEDLDDAKREIEDLKRRLDDADGIIGDDEDVSELMKKIDECRDEIDRLDGELQSERAKTGDLLSDNATLRSDLERSQAELANSEKEMNARVVMATALLAANLKDKDRELAECNAKIEELDQARLANLDVDAKSEIEKAKKEARVARTNSEKLKKEMSEMEILVNSKDEKVKTMEEKASAQKASETSLRQDLDAAKKEKLKAVKECESKFADKERKRKMEEEEKIKIFESKIRKLEAAAVGGVAVKAGRKSGAGDPNADKKMQRLEAQMALMKQQRQDDQNRIKELDRELKESKASAKGATVDKDKKAVDKKMKDLEKKLEMETKKFERELKRANELADELEQLKREHSNLQKEHAALTTECEGFKTAAATGAAMAAKIGTLESENKQLATEVKTLTDNYNTERVLRKKYYNMVEDMKGKIRVYCRYRPLSKTEIANKNKPVVKAPDEYTVQVEARGNLKEFQFDQVFTSDSTQEQVFEDTFNLVQSAVDGYNVCIFAYGQTGSGKTYTMIGGGPEQQGIAPRAFNRIFDLIQENEGKLKFEVSCYMLELYNEYLVDLLAPKGSKDAKLDIKKDKKGMVYVQGSVIQKAATAEQLYSLFQKGSESRHVASTKMNAESSRSHLVVAVILESVNVTTGAVTRGKLSLVDLAGSERVGKTGATAQQLKEANSINKSLSALGDVISALSSEQSFIPYRNNKLTMLMQDSLGGNAKTLMFVNISPADYNADETAISLTYASRVKLITNDASKNAESKEVARLRSMVAKLKAGEAIDEED